MFLPSMCLNIICLFLNCSFVVLEVACLKISQPNMFDFAFTQTSWCVLFHLHYVSSWQRLLGAVFQLYVKIPRLPVKQLPGSLKHNKRIMGLKVLHTLQCHLYLPILPNKQQRKVGVLWEWISFQHFLFPGCQEHIWLYIIIPRKAGKCLLTLILSRRSCFFRLVNCRGFHYVERPRHTLQRKHVRVEIFSIQSILPLLFTMD